MLQKKEMKAVLHKWTQLSKNLASQTHSLLPLAWVNIAALCQQ